MSKPIAIFDIDGSFARTSLLVEIFHVLVREGIFPALALREIHAHRVAWTSRQGSYYDYIMAVVDSYYRRIAGCNQHDVEAVGKVVAEEQRDRVYVYTRGRVQELCDTHHLVAISGSPIEVVGPFCEHWGFARTYASITEVVGGRYTGVRIGNASRDKRALVERAVTDLGATFDGSVGIGDTEGDFDILDRVAHPIAFNPNVELRNIARTRGWRIVVERKDVIYAVDGDRVSFLP